MPGNNLPLQLTSFIGRQREIAEIKDLLDEARLLTLTGPGGSGKTRLVLAAAAELLPQFPDGAWLVELAPLSDPGLVPEAITSVFGVPETPGEPLIETLAFSLRSKHLLLVLDNCEHLIEASARLAHTLLIASAGLHILATSREPLHIAGEIAWPVPSLSIPNLESLPPLAELSQVEAVRLFLDRARSVFPGFTLTAQNAPSVAQICCRLGGIPLAIELAAARIRVLSPEQIAARLDDLFRLLTGGDRTAPTRHQTLQAALDWSYRLLTEEEQALFRRLAVFAGGFDLEAVEAVFAPQAEGDRLLLPEAHALLDLVALLVDRSLVVAEGEHGASRRYRLLEPVRQYSLMKLRGAGEEEWMRDRHLDWCTAFAARAETELHGPGQVLFLHKLEAEHDNLRSALQWCLQKRCWQEGARLGGMLLSFWYVRGHWSEGRRWLEEFLAPEAGPTGQIRAQALYAAGFLGVFQNDYEKAETCLQESLSLFQEAGDIHGLAWVIFIRSLGAGDRGEYPRALEWVLEARSLFQEIGDLEGIAYTSHLQGEIARDQGDCERTAALCEESLALFRTLGAPKAISLSLSVLSWAYLCLGNDRLAQESGEEGLSLCRQLGDRRGSGMVLAALGKVAHHQGNYSHAFSLHRQALDVFIDVGDKWSLVLGLEVLAPTAIQLGLAEQAARWLGAAESLRDQFNLPLPLPDQESVEESLAVLRTRLGKAKYEAALKAGRRLSFEELSMELRAGQPAGEGSLPVDAPYVRQALTPLQAERREFGGLTRRERQVAALIAQGKSNAEIAAALYIGVRTVEAHVTGILNKLGYSSRTQVAGWVVERGLARPPETSGEN